MSMNRWAWSLVLSAAMILSYASIAWAQATTSMTARAVNQNVTLRSMDAYTIAHAKSTFDLQTATDINAAIDAGALSSEKLVGLYLKRIEAYDKKGPKINSVITLNPKALDEARALDAERKTKGRRSPLHGIPIVVKVSNVSGNGSELRARLSYSF